MGGALSCNSLPTLWSDGRNNERLGNAQDRLVDHGHPQWPSRRSDGLARWCQRRPVSGDRGNLPIRQSRRRSLKNRSKSARACRLRASACPGSIGRIVENEGNGSASRTRTCDKAINSDFKIRFQPLMLISANIASGFNRLQSLTKSGAINFKRQ